MSQAEALQRPYREKTLVLCIYEYIGREQNVTKRLTDGVMIKVEFSDQIADEFEAVMRKRSQEWNFNMPGLRPLEWTLKRWMSANGKRKF